MSCISQAAKATKTVACTHRHDLMHLLEKDNRNHNWHWRKIGLKIEKRTLVFIIHNGRWSTCESVGLWADEQIHEYQIFQIRFFSANRQLDGKFIDSWRVCITVMLIVSTTMTVSSTNIIFQKEREKKNTTLTHPKMVRRKKIRCLTAFACQCWEVFPINLMDELDLCPIQSSGIFLKFVCSVICSSVHGDCACFVDDCLNLNYFQCMNCIAWFLVTLFFLLVVDWCMSWFADQNTVGSPFCWWSF